MDQTENPDYLLIEVVQTEEIVKVELNELNLNRGFKIIYQKILKENKIKTKDAYISNPSGKAISSFDLNFTIRDLVKKFGNKLSLYNEKVM